MKLQNDPNVGPQKIQKNRKSENTFPLKSLSFPCPLRSLILGDGKNTPSISHLTPTLVPLQASELQFAPDPLDSDIRDSAMTWGS